MFQLSILPHFLGNPLSMRMSTYITIPITTHSLKVTVLNLWILLLPGITSKDSQSSYSPWVWSIPIVQLLYIIPAYDNSLISSQTPFWAPDSYFTTVRISIWMEFFLLAHSQSSGLSIPTDSTELVTQNSSFRFFPTSWLVSHLIVNIRMRIFFLDDIFITQLFC